MTNQQLKLTVFKLAVALFAMVGVLGAFQALSKCEKPKAKIRKAVYYYPEPADRYHDTTMSYGMRRVYNEYWEQ